MTFQGNEFVSNFYTKLKTVWREVKTYGEVSVCDCGNCTCNVNGRIKNRDEKLKVRKFLMGLNEEFRQLRSSILAMDSLLKLSKLKHFKWLLMKKPNMVSKKNKMLLHMLSMHPGPPLVRPGSKALSLPMLERPPWFPNQHILIPREGPCHMLINSYITRVTDKSTPNITAIITLSLVTQMTDAMCYMVTLRVTSNWSLTHLLPHIMLLMLRQEQRLLPTALLHQKIGLLGRKKSLQSLNRPRRSLMTYIPIGPHEFPLYSDKYNPKLKPQDSGISNSVFNSYTSNNFWIYSGNVSLFQNIKNCDKISISLPNGMDRIRLYHPRVILYRGLPHHYPKGCILYPIL